MGAHRCVPRRAPAREDAATFTDDETPYEHRKLWPLNGAHSLLAYAGSVRRHTTVAEAVVEADPELVATYEHVRASVPGLIRRAGTASPPS